MKEKILDPITPLLCFIASFLGLVSPGLAADALIKPLFPGIQPVCPCESLTNFSRPNTIVNSAVVDPTNGWCRVSLTVTHPPANDRIKIWIGLPTTNWNGRFRGVGGGGYVGGSPSALPSGVRLGFVTGATDTGHEGGSGKFALDENGRLNWHTIQDNAYLGIHEMTVVGKALTKVFYGKEPGYSYFIGSSTGGRQGLMEAQRFPEDYNGIVSGCPAINWQRFIPALLWPQMVMAHAKNYVSKGKMDAATAAAIGVCDNSDGVKDGVIDDPLKCGYDPKALVGTTIGEETFTEADADVIRKIWEGPRGTDGRFLWYGMERGADLFAVAGTSGTPLKGRPFSIPLEWVQYFLLQNPAWDWTTLTPPAFDQLWKQSVEQYGSVIGTDDPDLGGFRDRGGKIIIYHGMADQLIPAAGSIDYFKRVQKQMGGPAKTAEFARLFLAPGIDHGFRGAGPTPVRVFESLLAWVEEGKAPDMLLAEKRDANGKLIRSRPLFPYPLVSKYKGSGSPEDGANYISSSPSHE